MNDVELKLRNYIDKNAQYEGTSLELMAANEIWRLQQEIDLLKEDKKLLDRLERIDCQKNLFDNWIGGGGTLRSAIRDAMKQESKP